MSRLAKSFRRLGLFEYMHNVPEFESLVDRNDEFVILHDKYPKSNLHLLVIPRKLSIERINDLEPEHVDFLQRMKAYTEKVVADKFGEYTNLSYGFHVYPSQLCVL